MFPDHQVCVGQKKMTLTINNLSSEKTKQRSYVLTCSHWSSPHKMSHLAMCIFHIHETYYWQILPTRNNKAFSWPSMFQLLSNILFLFINRSSVVSSSGPLIVRKWFYKRGGFLFVKSNNNYVIKILENGSYLI